jgi:hypothetical protein
VIDVPDPVANTTVVSGPPLSITGLFDSRSKSGSVASVLSARGVVLAFTNFGSPCISPFQLIAKVCLADALAVYHQRLGSDLPS